MKIILIILTGIISVITFGILVFSIYNIVKCYKGVKTCNKGIIEYEENFNYQAISKYKRSISYFEDAIENYWFSIIVNSMLFTINITYLFLLVFNII